MPCPTKTPAACCRLYRRRLRGWVNPKYLYNPEHNIIAGTRYLRFLSNRYRGNIDLILAGYNAGKGAVDKYRGIPPYRETQNYVRLVKARYARLNGHALPVRSGQFAFAKVADSKPVRKTSVTDTRFSNQPARAVKAVHPVQIAQHVPERKSWDVFGDF